jgi:ribonuclease Z
MLAVTIWNNSALSMHDRHPTSQLVTNGEQLFLVDCGEGTQIQMNRYKIREQINHIFSHLHGDHYFGLVVC